MKHLLFCSLFIISNFVYAKKNYHGKIISVHSDKIEGKVISWREDIHQHPELGNREVRTAMLIAKHLQSLGIEVKTNVAVTGVVGILRAINPALSLAYEPIWMHCQ